MNPSRVTSEILDRIPPHDLQAERQTIGAMMLDESRIEDVAAIVRPEQFFADAHQRLARHLFAMHERGTPIDVTTLTENLRSAGDLEAVGGTAYIAEVIYATTAAVHAAHHAEIVRKMWAKREIIHAGCELVRNGHDGTVDPVDAISTLEAALAPIVNDRPAQGLCDAVNGTMQGMARVQEAASGRRLGLPTGLANVDREHGGLHGGEMIVLAARPGLGKTALGSGIAGHNSTNGRPVLVVELEMTNPEFFCRMLCSMAEVDGNRVRTGTLTAEDMEALAGAAGVLDRAALYVDQGPCRTVAQIRRIAARLRKIHGLQLIIVDYLGRVTPADPRAPRHEGIGQVARDLKTMARQLELPVLVLAQLNREIEKAGDHLPRLAHLRESGDIEQEADVVMFLHRPEVGRPDDPDLRGKAELIVAKNRNGKTGSFPLEWDSRTTTFSAQTPTGFDEFAEYAK